MFYHFSDFNVYRRVLLCLFIHFNAYVVPIKICKASYSERRE